MSLQRKTGRRPSDGRLRVLVGATAMAVLSAAAATYNWKEAVDGSFTDPACWAEGSVPGSLDTAQFNVEGTYAVTFDATVTNKSFNIKKGDVTFQLSGNTYRVMNNGEPRIGSQAGDIAALTVTGGVFHVTPSH